MTGLETIISQIAQDAKAEADELLAQANASASELTENAKLEAEKQTAAVLRKGDVQAKEIRERAESAAQLEKRNRLLRFKQQLIGEMIDSTRDALEKAPDEVYFSTLLKLAARFSQKGRGELRLNARDLSRLPADFEKSLKQAVPESEITVSRTPCDIESGFLLIYGEIDVNCTFRAIFDAAADQLRDAAGAVLFPEN